MADPVVAVKPEITPAEPTKAPDSEVDWKALAASEKARADQAEARAQSHEAQVAGLTRTFGSQIADNNRLVQAQAEAVKSGDWEPYEKVVKEINEKAAQANAAALNQIVIDRAAASIDKVEKKLGKDFVKDPLFESARKAWRDGNYAQAAIEANEVLAQIAEEGTAAEKKAAAKAVADARAAAIKETEEKLGKFELGAGAEAGGGGDSNYLQQLKKGGPLPSSEEIDRFTARYLKK